MELYDFPTGKYVAENNLKIQVIFKSSLKLSNSIYDYVKSINDTAKKTKGKVEFKSLKYKTEFELPLTEEDAKQIPDESLSMSVRISSTDNNIYNVNLSLNDFSRNLTISGKKLDYVTGLMSVIEDKINPYKKYCGGFKFRGFLGAMFMLICYSILGTIFGIYSKKIKPYIAMLIVICLTVCPSLICFFLPWEYLFPGTLILHHHEGFLTAQAPLFTFLGFILAFITIIIAVHKNASQEKLKKTGHKKKTSKGK